MSVEEILVHLADPGSRRQLCHLHPVLISSQSWYSPFLPPSASLPLSVSSLSLCSALMVWESLPLPGTLFALFVSLYLFSGLGSRQGFCFLGLGLFFFFSFCLQFSVRLVNRTSEGGQWNILFKFSAPQTLDLILKWLKCHEESNK